MEQNSLDQYVLVRKWKAECRDSVLKTIRKLRACTMEDIGKHLGWPDHCVSPRLTELKELNRILKVGNALNSRGNKCTVYSYNDAWGGVL